MEHAAQRHTINDAAVDSELSVGLRIGDGL
jgi:hypothetical protein